MRIYLVHKDMILSKCLFNYRFAKQIYSIFEMLWGILLNEISFIELYYWLGKADNASKVDKYIILLVVSGILMRYARYFNS